MNWIRFSIHFVLLVVCDICNASYFEELISCLIPYIYNIYYIVTVVIQLVMPGIGQGNIFITYSKHQLSKVYAATILGFPTLPKIVFKRELTLWHDKHNNFHDIKSVIYSSPPWFSVWIYLLS